MAVHSVNLASLAEAIRSGRVRVTDHADDEAVADRLSILTILAGIQSGEIARTIQMTGRFQAASY